MDMRIQTQQYLFIIDRHFHMKAMIIHKFEEHMPNTTEWDKQAKICNNHQIILIQSLNKSIQIKYIGYYVKQFQSYFIIKNI